jgi:uncharacterized membrane protein (UPF0182 family)
MITARELDVTRLPEAAKVWVNLALKYTCPCGKSNSFSVVRT